jgi:nucleoside-diphosphate-sugar epimerase
VQGGPATGGFGNREQEKSSVKVAVTGATGVIGAAAVRALVAAGHDVVALARTPTEASVVAAAGARTRTGSVADRASLLALLEGCDAVCNLATHIPVGYAALRRRFFRAHDRLGTDGVRMVVDAAREAGVRRVVQESVSLLYADGGDDWIDESSPLGITRVTEPASVAEAHVQEYACDSRVGVVLRFGAVLGDEATTHWMLGSPRRGRLLALGSPESWAHLVHTDDLGGAVLAALSAPTGVYNVGAEPVRRGDLLAAYAEVVGKRPGLLGRSVPHRPSGERAESLTRSLRVNSEHFTAQTGWVPRRPSVDASWFVVDEGREAVR